MGNFLGNFRWITTGSKLLSCNCKHFERACDASLQMKVKPRIGCANIMQISSIGAESRRSKISFSWLLSHSTYLSNVKADCWFHCGDDLFFAFVLQETFTIVAKVEQSYLSELSLQLIIELAATKNLLLRLSPTTGGMLVGWELIAFLQNKK